MGNNMRCLIDWQKILIMVTSSLCNSNYPRNSITVIIIVTKCHELHISQIEFFQNGQYVNHLGFIMVNQSNENLYYYVHFYYLFYDQAQIICLPKWNKNWPQSPFRLLFYTHPCYRYNHMPHLCTMCALHNAHQSDR